MTSGEVELGVNGGYIIWFPAREPNGAPQALRLCEPVRYSDMTIVLLVPSEGQVELWRDGLHLRWTWDWLPWICCLPNKVRSMPWRSMAYLDGGL